MAGGARPAHGRRGGRAGRPVGEREIVGWTASLRPRDPEGYRARLAACLAHERLTLEDLPLAASAVRAFNLHLYYEIRGRKSRRQREAAASYPAPA